MDIPRGLGSPREPEDPRTAAAIEQGLRFLENDETDRAIECFTEAIRLSPECSRAYRLRGHTFSQTGKWANAERDVAKARRAEARQP